MITGARTIIFLVCLLLTACVYAWLASPQQQRVRSGSAHVQSSFDTKETASTVIDPLDFREQVPLDFHEPERDLFFMAYRKTPAAKTVLKDNSVKVVKPIAPVILTPPKPKLTTKSQPIITEKKAPAPESIPALKVIGFLRNDLNSTVFLSTTKGELFLVREGDYFGENLMVKKIDPEQIVIRHCRDESEKILTVQEK